MKRWWVKALIGVVVVLALAVLALQFSGVRSRNTVEAYKEQLRSG